MAKRLNKKLVAGLTIAGMAVTTAAAVLMIYQLRPKDPKPFLDKAVELEARGEFEQAAEYYRRAHARARSAGRDLAECHSYLLKAGDMSMASGDARGAVGAWRQVILGDPRSEAARERLVDFNVELAKLTGAGWDQVRTEAEELLRINENNFTGLHALGRALVEQRGRDEQNLDKGRQLLIKAFEGDRSNPEFANSLAILYLTQSEGREEDIRKAEEVYDTLIRSLQEAASPDAGKLSTAWRYRGQFCLARRSQLQSQLQQLRAGRVVPMSESELLAELKELDARGRECLDKALEADPKNVDNLIGMGLYWQTRAPLTADEQQAESERTAYRQEAEKFLRQAIEIDPESYDAYLRLSALFLSERKLEEARQVLEERIRRGVKRSGYLAWRHKMYMALIRSEAFRICMAQIDMARTAGDRKQLEKVRGESMARMEELYREQVSEAEGGERDRMALFMKARLQMVRGENLEAIRSLREAEKVAGGMNPEVKLYLASLLLDQGQPGAAEQEVRAITAVAPGNVAAQSLLSRALVELKRFDEAMVVAQQVLTVDPRNQQALQSLARVYEAQQNYDKLKEINHLLAGTDPSRDRLLEAALLRSQATAGETVNVTLLKEAEQILRELLDRDPLNILALQQLIGSISDRTRGRDEAVRAAGFKEITEAIDRAAQEVQGKLADPAVPEAEMDRYRRTKNALDAMRVYADPAASEEDKFAKTEELIRQNQDPFQVALDLFSLYRRSPERQDDAYAQLRQAVELARASTNPEERAARLRATVDTLFRLALARKDWALAEQLVKDGVEVGVAPAGGRFWRAEILLENDALEDRLTKAERELREGLAMFTDYPRAHVSMGRVMLGLGRADEAEKYFGEAYRLDPGNSMAALGLATLADQKGNAADKEKYLKACGELIPDHPWVKEQLQLQQDARDPVKAIAEREAQRLRNPKDGNNALRLATLYQQAGQPDKAREVFESFLQVEPTDLGFVQAYAKYLRAQQPPEYKAAEELLRRTAEKVDPGDKVKTATARLLLAAHMEMMQARGIEGAPTADAVAEAFREAGRLSGAARTLLDVAAHFRRAREYPECIEWLRKALAAAEQAKEADQELRARREIITTMFQARARDQRGELQKEIESYQARYPKDPFGLMAMSQFFIQGGQVEKALEYMDRYVAGNASDPQGYLTRANIHLSRSAWNLAIRDFQQVKALAPRGFDYEPRRLLAVCFEQTRQDDLAINELVSILQDAPGNSAALGELFRMLMKLGRFEQAEQLVLPLAQQNPDNPFFPMRLSEILMARTRQARQAGAPEAARFEERCVEYARQAAQRSGFDPQGISLVADTCIKLGRHDEAIRFLESEIPEAQRGMPGTWAWKAAALAGKDDRAGAVEAARQALKLAARDVPSMMQIFQSVSSVLGPEQTGEILEAQLAADPSSVVCRLAATRLRLIRKDTDGFIADARAMLADLPAEGDANALAARVDLMRTLAIVLYGRKEYAEARSLYEQLLRINPEDGMVLNNLAYLLMEDLNDPTAARVYAEKAAELNPNEPNVLDTLGWNLILLGDHDGGIAMLREALGTGARMPVLHYHLAVGLQRRGQASKNNADLEDARAECRRAHEMIFSDARDEAGILSKIVDLGRELGLTLEPELPGAPAGTAPAVAGAAATGN